MGKILAFPAVEKPVVENSMEKGDVYGTVCGAADEKSAAGSPAAPAADRGRRGPQGLVGLIFCRSGLGVKHGVSLPNCVGVIDSDYRGELIVPLRNFGDKAYTIQPGERIAQLVLVPVFLPPVAEVEELSETQRGTGGFGSTGK